MKAHHDTCIEVASDDLAVSEMKVEEIYPVVLNSLVEALQSKGNRLWTYPCLWVCIMVTRTFGSTLEAINSFGKFHNKWHWKVPLLKTNKLSARLLSELPKYHTWCMRREFMSRFGQITSGTNPFILCGIYRELTGEYVDMLHLMLYHMQSRWKGAPPPLFHCWNYFPLSPHSPPPHTCTCMWKTYCTQSYNTSVIYHSCLTYFTLLGNAVAI